LTIDFDTLGLHCLDTAMIKFLDESGSISYCLCTVHVSCIVMQFFSTFFYGVPAKMF